jgi:hypothetical protein
MVVCSLIKKKNHPTRIPNNPMMFCLVSLLHCPGIAIIPDPRKTLLLSKQGPLFSDQKGDGRCLPAPPGGIHGWVKGHASKG